MDFKHFQNKETGATTTHVAFEGDVERDFREKLMVNLPGVNVEFFYEPATDEVILVGSFGRHDVFKIMRDGVLPSHREVAPTTPRIQTVELPDPATTDRPSDV